MDEIKRAKQIEEGIAALELASGETLTAVEFVRSVLGANLDKLVADGARNNPNLRDTVRTLVGHAIEALEELGTIPKGLYVMAVTQGKVHFVVADHETRAVLLDLEDENRCRKAYDRMRARGHDVKFHRVDERDVVGVEFGVIKGTPTKDIEKLLSYLGGQSNCLV